MDVVVPRGILRLATERGIDLACVDGGIDALRLKFDCAEHDGRGAHELSGERMLSRYVSASSVAARESDFFGDCRRREDDGFALFAGDFIHGVIRFFVEKRCAVLPEEFRKVEIVDVVFGDLFEAQEDGEAVCGGLG